MTHQLKTPEKWKVAITGTLYGVYDGKIRDSGLLGGQKREPGKKLRSEFLSCGSPDMSPDVVCDSGAFDIRGHQEGFSDRWGPGQSR